jgi:hypothetical protein
MVVVLHCVETGTWSFSCPAGGCYIDAEIYPVMGFPPVVICLRSTRGLLWRLGACFHVDHLVLAVWLGNKLALLLMLPLMSLVRCSLFPRLTRMMSRDFVRGFLCFPAPGFPH